MSDSPATITNWGRFPSVEAIVRDFRTEDELAALLETCTEVIPRGMGRCYGDSALAPDIISTRRFNRVLAFDTERGTLTCEAGVTFEQMIDICVPHGWFPPVIPGTKHVSVGGAIASDVHGKNHPEAGCFSDHLRTFDLMLPDARVVTCSRDQNPELFRATCGGMGLTGVVLRAEFALRAIETAYFVQENVVAQALDGVLDLFEGPGRCSYEVAWLDCLARGSKLGRAILTRGEHAGTADLARSRNADRPLAVARGRGLSVPIDLPGFALNRLTVRAFNALYYAIGRVRAGRSIADYETFFFRLDAVGNWNRLYGRRGFTQYQFVLPGDTSRAGLAQVLEKASRRGPGVFLGVLKRFGRQEGMLSFPREGYSLALDFPVAPGLFELLDELDRIVLDHGGRHYLAKDARLGEEAFRRGYPDGQAFSELKRRIDPQGRFQSLQSRRVMGSGTRPAAAADRAP